MTAVSELQTEIERAEEAYEFLISYAGKGLDRYEAGNATAEVRHYVEQLAEAIEAGHAAATDVSDEYDVEWGDQLDRFLTAMSDEVDEALLVLDLLAAQDRITSAQVDNMNGMSVFQSVIMKFFFLDEVTEHLDWDEDPAAEGADGDGD